MRAKIRRDVLGVLMVFALVFAPGAQPQAAVVNSDGTGVTSIDALVVGAVTYDISFGVSFTQYDVAFPAGDLFSNAEAIADAIIFQLNSAGSPPPFISRGGGNIALGFDIPFAVSDLGGVDIFGARCAEGTDSCSAVYLPFTGRCQPECGTLWAFPVMSAVPLPAALPLFGSALAMLGMVGWRRRRQAGA